MLTTIFYKSQIGYLLARNKIKNQCNCCFTQKELKVSNEKPDKVIFRKYLVPIYPTPYPRIIYGVSGKGERRMKPLSITMPGPNMELQVNEYILKLLKRWNCNTNRVILG